MKILSVGTELFPCRPYRWTDRHDEANNL